jgi:signal transduction protein with GAF and PtsI domain
MQAKEQDYFSAFVSVSKAISSTLNLQEVLNLILKHAVSSLGLKAGAISLLDKKNNRLQLIANRNLSREYLDKGPVAADKSMPGAISDKRPVVVPDVTADSRLQYPEACEERRYRIYFIRADSFQGQCDRGASALWCGAPGFYLS